MSSQFCKACGLSMVAHSAFCQECGTADALEFPAALHLNATQQSRAVATFFASQATLCLFTLLVFLGLVVALAPAGWRYASLQLKPGTVQTQDIAGSRSLGTSNSSVRCSQIVVIFNAATTVLRVSTLLEQLDATISYGPNENGAFELSTPSIVAAEVAEALNRAGDVVVSASLQRRCM